jgi:hypothetical protein
MRSGLHGFTADGKETRKAGASSEKVDVDDLHAGKSRVAGGLEAFPGEGCVRPGKIGQGEVRMEAEQALGDLQTRQVPIRPPLSPQCIPSGIVSRRAAREKASRYPKESHLDKTEV